MIYSFIYISQSRQLSSSSTKQVDNLWSLPTEIHADARLTYHGLRPGSSKESFTTLLFLPSCHTAFGMIFCIFGLVDQSSVVISAGCPLHTCYHHPRDIRCGLNIAQRLAEEPDSWEHNVKCCLYRYVTFNYGTLNEICANHGKRLGGWELSDAFVSWGGGTEGRYFQYL
jgi:hypothetical protein